jgi:hypothetical protein
MPKSGMIFSIQEMKKWFIDVFMPVIFLNTKALRHDELKNNLHNFKIVPVT